MCFLCTHTKCRITSFFTITADRKHFLQLHLFLAFRCNGAVSCRSLLADLLLSPISRSFFTPLTRCHKSSWWDFCCPENKVEEREKHLRRISSCSSLTRSLYIFRDFRLLTASSNNYGNMWMAIGNKKIFLCSLNALLCSFLVCLCVIYLLLGH